MIDVAVIGGGPAGLLAATRLAQSGLDVLVFEEHATIGNPSHCTGIVSLETAELAKIPEGLVLGRFSRARLMGPGGAEAAHDWQADDAIVCIDRAAFDAGLAQQAIAAGAGLSLGNPVHNIELAADGVSVHAACGPMRARACILACGVSYRLQRLLGLGLPALVSHTAQTEVDAESEDTIQLHFGRALARNGFVWTVPIVRDGRSRLKIGVLASGDAGASLRQFLARPDVQMRLRGEPAPAVRRLLPLKTIAKTYAERLLVVGDAGGFTKPTTGGGIFYSLLSASLSADTLLEAFAADRFDTSFLARYEDRWRDRLGSELRVAHWLRRLVTHCSDPEIDSLVRALGAGDIQALVRRTARFNWHADLILALGRRPDVARLLLRAFLR